MSRHIEYFDPPELPEPYGYRHAAAIRGGRLVFCAGQVAADRDGNPIAPGDHATQARRALLNVVTALEAAGASAQSIVKLNVYVVGLEKPGVHDACYQGFAQASREKNIQAAPSTMVGVTALVHPDLVIEIDAVAVAAP